MADRNVVRVPRQREATTSGNYASLYVDAATGRVTVRHPGWTKSDLQRPTKIRGNPAKCLGDLHVTGQLGVGVAAPDASSALEIVSTTQGLLLPRMTTGQRNAISSPTNGLVIYNSTLNKVQARANGAWVSLHA